MERPLLNRGSHTISFFGSHEHADVIIKCQGEMLPAHKIVLVSQSEYFAKALSQNFKVGGSNVGGLHHRTGDTG